MSEHNEKEVRFDIYCDKCLYKELPEEEEPCRDCLTQTVNTNSKKPVFFKSTHKITKTEKEQTR